MTLLVLSANYAIWSGEPKGSHGSYACHLHTVCTPELERAEYQKMASGLGWGLMFRGRGRVRHSVVMVKVRECQ